MAKFRSVIAFSAVLRLYKIIWEYLSKQLGAGVARGAHNPEVAGSKPAVAINALPSLFWLGFLLLLL